MIYRIGLAASTSELGSLPQCEVTITKHDGFRQIDCRGETRIGTIVESLAITGFSRTYLKSGSMARTCWIKIDNFLSNKSGPSREAAEGIRRVLALPEIEKSTIVRSLQNKVILAERQLSR